MGRRELTRELAWAAAADAGDRSMRRGGRKTWGDDDADARTAEFDRLWPEWRDLGMSKAEYDAAKARPGSGLGRGGRGARRRAVATCKCGLGGAAERLEERTKVTTDGRWKEFKFYYDVPKKVMKDQFSWFNEEKNDVQGFVLYNGHWYYLSEFERVPAGWFKGQHWNGYSADSFFSGVVVIEISSDGERYRIGTYIS